MFDAHSISVARQHQYGSLALLRGKPSKYGASQRSNIKLGKGGGSETNKGRAEAVATLFINLRQILHTEKALHNAIGR